MKRNKLSLFSIPYVVWMAIFVVIPILMVVVYAFSSAGGGFTLDNFARIWDYAVVFTRSFKLALIATVGQGMVRTRGTAAKLFGALYAAGQRRFPVLHHA